MTPKYPKVSIIVVSYNQSKYIKENLNSIKSQSYSNIELIVADDASSDDSVKVFDDWLAENNFHAIKNYHEKNTGLATILNECIEMTTGYYIKIIAADDYLHQDAILKCINTLESLDSSYGMVFTDTCFIDSNSRVQSNTADYNKLGLIGKEEFRESLLHGNRIAALTVLMRKDVLIETGPYDSQFILEDYYRWLKIAEKYYIAYVPSKLAYYRIHEENISKLKIERIKIEEFLLRMQFDKKGIFKDSINYKIQSMYLSHNMTKEIIKYFQTYTHRSKRMSFALKYRIPVYLYKLIFKNF